MARRVGIAIPLIGRHLAADWGLRIELLRDTLRSVRQQSSSQYQLAIATNDPDEVRAIGGPGVHIIETAVFSAAELATDGRKDLRTKRKALRSWAAEGELSDLFMLDADDFIHRDLVRFIVEHATTVGHLIPTGWLLDHQTGIVCAFPDAESLDVTFDRKCGSSVSVALGRKASAAERLNYLEAIWAQGHHRAREQFAAVRGEAAIDVSFAAGIYRLNSSANISVALASGSAGSFADSLFARSGALPSQSLRDEFGLAPA